MLLSEMLASSAKNHAHETAIFFREESISYSELQSAVDKLAAGLLGLGIGPGDRIGLLLPNCPAFILGYYAAARIGAIAVPANPLLKPAELEYIWKDAGILLVITAPIVLANVREAQRKLPLLKQVVTITSTEDHLPETNSPLPLITLSELSSAGDLSKLPSFEGRSDRDCAVIIYTSGTTGFPKGAMLSHFNLTRNIEQIQAALHFNNSDRFLTIIPLFHSFAASINMNLSLATGAATVLMESFTPARALEAIQKRHVSVFPAVPAIYNAILAHKSEVEYDISSLKMFVSGGAPLPETTLKALEERFQTPVLEGDGPTECSPVTSVNRPEGPRKIGSVGPPLPGVEFRIFDDRNQSLPTGEIGEIVVRGDNVMLGYLNQPEATREAMAGGWYHTGDLGKLDEDGFLFIVDRKKDMIITAGLNVYPREIEEALYQHPAVREAAVIGQPDALRGEEVVAVVVLQPDSKVGEREILGHCRKLLANYKVPRRILFRDALPRGGTGKVVKRLLKKELELESTGA